MRTLVPILPILEHYGSDELPETLGWRSVRCVFHDDRHASARYCASDQVQAFMCMACEAKGDAIALVRQQEGLDYREALLFIEQITGQQLARSSKPAPRAFRPVRLGEQAEGSVPATPPARRTVRRRQRRRRLIE